MKRKGIILNGWLALDKSAGLTSTQAMAKVRWLLNAQKAGHGGTLDPLATGVLPIALGEATKTVSYIMDATKRYRFTLKFGAQTTTDDLEGEVMAQSEKRASAAEIEAALPQFMGDISQVPPRFSALKVDGERAYDLARSGEAFELASRQVRIDAFSLISLDNPDEAVFEVVCGKGTYIRSLARDLAQVLDTVGHVSLLRRLQVGRFSEKDSISLDELSVKVQNTPADQLLLPIETALGDIPALAITETEAQRLRMGQTVSLLQMSNRDRVLALPENVRLAGAPVIPLLNGKPVAIAEVAAGELRVVRGFSSNT